ncbi:MAG: B12-binding domain-containing radical SAM protein [Candidatus Omnitrophica bacterium]|nr:B12-binding domain-containing radical SAM protein [Candidatus Omnitrophota bacterium]
MQKNRAIVFINPPHKQYIQRKMRCSPVRSGYLFPPMELLYLATIIHTITDVEKVFIDAVVERLSVDDIIAKIQQYDVQMIVFMPAVESWDVDVHALSLIKEAVNKHCFLVCFGYIPSLFYRELFNRFPTVDCVIIGEPDRTFQELCEIFFSDRKKIFDVKGLAFNIQHDYITTERRHNELVLDSLPIPDRKYLNNSLYGDPFVNKPMTAVMTGRGCLYACTFCVNFYGVPFRLRSSENVLNELEQIVHEFNIRDIRFMDDHFTVDKQRTIAICKGIIDRSMNIRFTCLSRVDTLDEESIGYLKRAGCQMVFLGIESGSQRILDYYNKRYTVDRIRQTCRILKRAGIAFTGWFVIGAPIETPDDIRQSIRLALDIKADFIIVNELHIMPATPLFNTLRDDLIVNLVPFSVSYQKRCIPSEALPKYRYMFYVRFYVLSLYFIRNIGMCLKNPKRLWFFMKEFYSGIQKHYVEK